MQLAKLIGNSVALVIGVIALPISLWLAISGRISQVDLTVLFISYALTGLGITLGYHRLLTHRSFRVPKWLEYTWAILGSMALQGPVLEWVADHRKHHAFSDTDQDPHSPVSHGRSLMAAFWHAHVGWLVRTQGTADIQQYAKDLAADKGMRTIDRQFGNLALLSLVLPGLMAYALDGTWQAALSGMWWGGITRVCLLHHATFSINSICHLWGSRRYDTTDNSRNVGWLAIPTFGESWHHNHHAFPSSAAHGLEWWQVDLTAYTIHAMRVLGLASAIIEVSDERRSARAARAAKGPRVRRTNVSA